MNAQIRNIILFFVVVAVVVSIYYLESQKVSLPSSPSSAASITIATSTPHTADYATLAKQYPAAKELVSPDGYINTGTNADGSAKPITIQSLVGKKVVLLDFWTYSCINCQRTIPYLNAWYGKYKDLGLEIIGVQSPEFNFEKVLGNVQAAVTKFGMKYPVVLDNEMGTWNAYGNEYWPEEYMIDINGLVVDRNIGEGNYAQTEHTIQKLLQERSDVLGLGLKIPTDLVGVNPVAIEASSPETYFGSGRNQYLANGAQATPGVQNLSITDDGNVQLNALYLGGAWNFQDQYAQSQSADATIVYNYDAQHVYLVAASADASKNISITVMRDGKPLTTDRGADVDAQGNATINQSRLYDLIDQPSMGAHTLEIIVHNPGLQAYTFTFG
jgi:thiol-disulfide isomerase/thioredoxin